MLLPCMFFIFSKRKCVFYFVLRWLLDVIWLMIHQQTVCGISSQSHGVERYRLNLDAFKFQLMITDYRLQNKMQGDAVLDTTVCE